MTGNGWRASSSTYREAAGITDPQQAIGPVPSGKAHLAEAFHASVRALRLPDEAALLRAMNQGQLEAGCRSTSAPRPSRRADVQAEVGDREHSLEEARARERRGRARRERWRRRKPPQPRPGGTPGTWQRLAVADAARREWREATVAQETAAREAGPNSSGEAWPSASRSRTPRWPRPRRNRGRSPPMDPAFWAQSRPSRPPNARRTGKPRPNGGRRLPVTDAELGGLGRRPPSGPRPKRLQKQRPMLLQPSVKPSSLSPRRPGGSSITPVIPSSPGATARPRLKDGRPEVSPERAADEADLAEARAEIERLGELVGQIPDRAAERRAEMDQAGINEPVVHEPQAEPSLEASWQPGDAQGQ